MKTSFKIHFLTYIILFIALLCGQFQTIFFFLLLSFLHEMGHFMMCKCLRVEVKNVEILPFGCSMQIHNAEQIEARKQIMIYLAGPAMFFVHLVLIFILKVTGLISPHTYSFMMNANKIISIFNLLFMYPLDGYQIMRGVLTHFLPYKIALRISVLLSLLTFVLFIVYNCVHFQLLLLIFLFIEQVKYLKKYKELYYRFLIYKTKRKKHPRFCILKKPLLFKDRNNYMFAKDKILDDVDIAYEELKQYSKIQSKDL